MLRFIVSVFFLVWLPLATFAASKTVTFQEGRDYEVMSHGKMPSHNHLQRGKVEVVEFFSYGCPWCYRLEPTLLDWARKNRKKIDFQRVPVIFEDPWEVFARAYYLAKALKLDEKLSLDLFSAIQNGQLRTEQDLKGFFIDHGVKADTFEKAYISPIIDSNMMYGAKLSRQYRVDRVPTIVVAGEYKTDIGRVDGDSNKFAQLIGFLVKTAIHEKVSEGLPE